MRTHVMVLTLLVGSAANAGDTTKDCFEVPGVEKDPVVTLSGRVTKQHGKDWFLDTDKRPAHTLLLKLDTPLRTRLTGEGPEGCDRRREIAIFDDPDKLAKWIGRRVTITGELGRWGSALPYPSIYIKISRMRRLGRGE